MQIMTREEVLLRDELDRTYARLLEAQAKAAEAPHRRRRAVVCTARTGRTETLWG